ncbi:DUF930 domain-containing protein [Ancylobacter sp.]|uniref:DUF930 domain-containing protein n=1 Tax=Ancylobacter sp. TaxID=1872567 RepID=UPI003D1347CD
MTLVPSTPYAEGGMRQHRPPCRRSGAYAARLAGSALLHLGVLAAIFLASARSFPEPAEVPALETEIISSRDFAALRAAPPPQPPSPSVEALRPAGTAAAPSLSRVIPAKPAGLPEMVRPSRMLSEQALGNPRSRGLRRELGRLGEEDRLAQLCNLEAMEQIHAWHQEFQPDRLVDYASGDAALEGSVFIAKGGAFRSQRTWYDVSYRCELDEALRKVVGFAFRVGAAIPRDDWASYNLPTLH